MITLRRRSSPDFRLLFPTDFSASCRRAGTAIARWAEVCHVDLTIAHVTKPASDIHGARADLESFLGDTGVFRTCRRLLVEGPEPSESIAELCDRHRFDLIVAPVGASQGIPRLLQRSFRARLLSRCHVPLWTIGRHPEVRLDGPPLAVACLVDFDGPIERFVRLVTAFAARFNARLHVLAVVPPIDDGVLAEVLTSDSPLAPDMVVNRIQSLFPAGTIPPIDVAVGSSGRGVRRLLDRQSTDLLFVSRRQWASMAPIRFPRALDSLKCPVVCLDADAAAFPGWSFEEAAAQLAQVPPSDGALAVAG